MHRWMGASLFLLFLVMGATGLLLGWKKHSGGLILAPTYQGSSTDLEEWLDLDSLRLIAYQALHREVDSTLSLALDRIDCRPEKGTVKFVFADHYWGVQVDAATGRVLHLEHRTADLLENIHDGSILDKQLNTAGDYLKLIYISLMGLALLGFSVTGFWLWYGPKVLRGSQ